MTLTAYTGRERHPRPSVHIGRDHSGAGQTQPVRRSLRKNGSADWGYIDAEVLDAVANSSRQSWGPIVRVSHGEMPKRAGSNRSDSTRNISSRQFIFPGVPALASQKGSSMARPLNNQAPITIEGFILSPMQRLESLGLIQAALEQLDHNTRPRRSTPLKNQGHQTVKLI